MKYKVGDKVRVRIDLVPSKMYGSLTFLDGNMSKCAGQICTIMEVLSDKKYYVSENPFAWSEEMLEPVGGKTLRMADGTIIGEFNTGGFCDGFRGGKIPNDLIVSHTEMERAIDELSDALSDWATNVQLDKETVFNGLSQVLKRATEVYSSTKEEKNLKFTFYVKEGTRPDKKCNGTIPTMTTTVVSGLDEVSVTCDKADYNERQGVLEGIAQLYCKGRFDKEYEAAIKINKRSDEANRTCIYCGKIFDTAEERAEHEKWHVERRKARHERYLLRKRAKEIAFEEQAQKMAKEMMGEQK